MNIWILKRWCNDKNKGHFNLSFTSTRGRKKKDYMNVWINEYLHEYTDTQKVDDKNDDDKNDDDKNDDDDDDDELHLCSKEALSQVTCFTYKLSLSI